eukprot:TRINITY_DN5498_c0_g1_i3.p1 TRINITY_DN5498_c0_g1~~TRINITY_DN5498_c0_g1_i3.p1  ORF type:complete len:563 (-),score=61.79 TRINITY_DN5498_c0_g1_i3:332-2020(-)
MNASIPSMLKTPIPKSMEIRIPSQLPCSLTRTKHLPFPLHLSYSSPSSSLCRASIRTTSKSPLPSFRTSCIRPVRGNADRELDSSPPTFDTAHDDASAPSFSSDVLSGAKSATIWRQVKEIVQFAGPATGLWICGPLMGLIDTVVLGRSSSLELAALGPGTVVCDNTSYAFMFLSIATSNMVATARAKKDNNLLQHQISMLLFIAFTCGLGMLFLMKFMGVKIIAAFTGPKNLHMVPAANTYVQIRGLAWPAILVGMVAQSASLGMKDSWGPLKALAVAGAVNAFGAILLCSILGYGIAGAACATLVAQVIAGFMMIGNLNRTGFSAYSVSIPSPNDLLQIFEIAAPVFITMTSKIAFYSLLTYFATSMGTVTIAAHQVMIGVYCICTVWGEPLSQTAQSFMPEFLYGVNQNLMKARMLLQSLVIVGAFTGLVLGIVGSSVPWFLPYTFTSDHAIIGEMHRVLLPFFVALVVTPSTHSLEGTLLAVRDLRFLSTTMSGCLLFGGLLLLFLSNKGFGLRGFWWALAGFQWARFSLALQRVASPHGMLYCDEFQQPEFGKLKAT